MVSAAVDFVPSLMPDVDLEVCLNYTFAMTAGGQMFIYKLMAIGGVTFDTCLFYTLREWQQHRQQRQQEEQHEQQQTTTLAIYSQLGEGNSQLGFDFDRFEVQDDHQLFYRLLFADNKKMKQQLREQEQKLEQRETAHAHEIQQLQVGKDTKDEQHHEEVQ